ncbi:MAG: NAD(P)/FAD-dependent oxidoreductase, partial [Desulfobulbales bacterium]
MKDEKNVYDCLIIGAGPGGLQAAIHLARYNRKIIVIDRGAGRTTHAAHIVNYLGLSEISGRELIAAGLEQVKKFGAETIKDTVILVEKKDIFTVHTPRDSFQSRFVIVSAGAVDRLPRLRNLGRFFGRSFFTCVDCDGYLTTGRKVLVMGNSVNAARLVRDLMHLCMLMEK